jgi:uncharacterized membrane protein
VEAKGRNDFNIFLDAARDLAQGKNIYTSTYYDGYHYYYSSLFALLLLPFTYLPDYVVKALWLGANIFFIYRLWSICSSFIDLTKLSKKLLLVLAVLSFLFVIRFIRDNLHVGQMTICMLYLSMEGLSFILKGKTVAGAALIALAINIKLLPLVMLPYLLYRRELSAAALVIMFYAVLMLLPSVFIGHDYNMFLLSEWWKLVNPTNTEHVIDVSERSFHGLSTLLPVLLMSDVHEAYALPLKRNIADLTAEQVNLILNITRLALMSLTLYFLRTLPLKKAPSLLHTLWETSYIFLIVPLIFPHQQHYSFFFIFPAVIYLLYFLSVTYQINYSNFSKSRFITVVIMMIMIFLICNSTLILGHFREYYDHFKILTYAVLLLIVPLAICRPSLIAGK